MIRNFDHEIVHLEVDPSGATAEVAGRQAPAPGRVLTTDKLLAGRMLLVDSHFDEETGTPPYEVLTQRMPR